MAIFKSIVCECNYCGITELLTLTKTISEAKKKLLKWGWIYKEKKYFCCVGCKNEYEKE